MAFEMDCINQPAKYSNLNEIENIWAPLARSVYYNEKQYEKVSTVQNTIWKAWNEISGRYVQSFYLPVSICWSF